MKIAEERSQLRLAEQNDLASFLESKTEEANRLRTDLRSTSEALTRAQEAKISATLEAESAVAREEALKAELNRLRAMLETSRQQLSDYQKEMQKQREELVEAARDRGAKALKYQMALSDKIEEVSIFRLDRSEHTLNVGHSDQYLEQLLAWKGKVWVIQSLFRKSWYGLIVQKINNIPDWISIKRLGVAPFWS